jgi:hypothetical protein
MEEDVCKTYTRRFGAQKRTSLFVLTPGRHGLSAVKFKKGVFLCPHPL